MPEASAPGPVWRERRGALGPGASEDRAARRASLSSTEPAVHDRLLRELVFFAFSAERTVDPWLVRRLARSLGSRRVAAGDSVFQAGELPEAIHFMSQGRVRFSRQGSPDIEREGRWVLGFQEAVSMTPRRRTAVAITDLELLTVPAATWLEILDDRLDLARDLALELARVVAGMRLRLPSDGGYGPVDASCHPWGEAMSVVERMLCLRGVPLLSGGGVQPLADLSRGAREVRFEGGADLAASPGWSERLHVIVSGRVELAHRDPDLAATFGPGELVGGAAALGPLVRGWGARALEPSRLLAIPFELWVDEVEDHFGLFRSAVSALLDEREDLTDQIARRTGQTVFR